MNEPEEDGKPLALGLLAVTAVMAAVTIGWFAFGSLVGFTVYFSAVYFVMFLAAIVWLRFR